MPNARITARDSRKAAALAAHLRELGYQVELSQDFSAPSAADSQFAVFPLSVDEALQRARDVAAQRGCELFIAPGVVKVQAPVAEVVSAKPVEPKPPLTEASPVPAERSPLPIYQNSAIEPEVVFPYEEEITEPEPAKPSAVAQFLRTNLPVWRENLRRGRNVSAATIASGSAALVAALSKARTRSLAQTRLVVAHLQSGLRSFASAQSASWAAAHRRWSQQRAERRARLAASPRVEALTTPLARIQTPQLVAATPARIPARAVPRRYSRSRDVQMAFVGAAMAAFLMMIFFGAFNTPIPAATPSSTAGNVQQGMPFGAVTLHPVHRSAFSAPRPSSAPVQRSIAAPASSSAKTPIARVQRTKPPARRVSGTSASDDDVADDEVIVRHFGPAVSSTTSKDGIKHLSDQ